MSGEEAINVQAMPTPTVWVSTGQKHLAIKDENGNQIEDENGNPIEVQL